MPVLLKGGEVTSVRTVKMAFESIPCKGSSEMLRIQNAVTCRHKLGHLTAKKELYESREPKEI